ncbi:hypothetical protein TNCV_1247511 [Trichonephila clavipes]|nr:hypothetical protein TNCV_1247511 [Trichonephila clavipes]
MPLGRAETFHLRGGGNCFGIVEVGDTGNRDYTGMWVRLGSTDLMASKVVFLRGLLSPIRVVDLTYPTSLIFSVRHTSFSCRPDNSITPHEKPHFESGLEFTNCCYKVLESVGSDGLEVACPLRKPKNCGLDPGWNR